MRPLTICASFAPLGVALLVAGCGANIVDPIEEEEAAYEDPGASGFKADQSSLVGDFIATHCSTEVISRLSLQIVQEARCLGALLEPISESDGIVFENGAVLPYLERSAVEDLRKVATHLRAIDSDREIHITSAYRTVADQLLLYSWFSQRRCNIPAAAMPGQSNHEDGRAIDVKNYGEMIRTMARYGWKRPMARDVVHFQHAASSDLSGLDVMAFQRLWNRARPNDRITESGEFDTATEKRIKKSPALGFSDTAVSCPITD